MYRLCDHVHLREVFTQSKRHCGVMAFGLRQHYIRCVGPRRKSSFRILMHSARSVSVVKLH